jgi:DNA (cytosine-5)-methyltransferase 1
MVRCARQVRPRVMALENVEEFRDWCPLTRDGRPDPAKRGQTFERFKARLRNLGYTMEFREDRASNHGAPTIRKRLFGVFRRDGGPIMWSAPSHGPRADRPFRTAAECIDFSLPAPSIFLTPSEAKAWGKARGVPAPKRPLAAASLRRVARGVVRYVIENPKPFIVRYNSERRNEEFRGQGIDAPLSTLDTSNRFGLVAPVITPVTHRDESDRTHSANEPIPTITGANRGEFALIAPVLAGVGGRKGQSPETSVDRPFHTITTKADTALIAATLVNTRNGERAGQAPRVRDIDAPLNTITAQGSQGAMVTADMAPLVLNNSETRDARVHPANEPIRTITAAGGRTNQLVTAFLAKHNGGHEATGQVLDRPVDTLVARDNKALVSSLLVSLRGNITDHANTGRDVREPAPTLTAGGTHVAEIRTVLVAPEFVEAHPRAPLVAAFLLKYFGSKKDGCRLDVPLHTVTTKHRYALVVVTIDGQDFAIVDIGMRMLTPRELFLCQGFPPDYKIDITVRLKRKRGRRYVWIEKPLTKGAQVRLCGNSVSPPHARAVVFANYVEQTAVAS